MIILEIVRVQLARAWWLVFDFEVGKHKFIDGN